MVVTSGSTRLNELLPDGCHGVVVDVATSTVGVEELWPEERESISGAVERRRREFAIGRVAARQAMARLGSPSCAIPVGQGRQPLWPAGHTGSISHTKALVAAAVGPTSSLRSLGIDVELAGSVSRELFGRILRRPEQAEVASRPDLDLPTLIFSVKESVYKALYPLHQQWLGFLDVQVEVVAEVAADDGEGRLAGGLGRFVASICPLVDHAAAGASLEGRWGRAGGHVFTAVWL